MAGNVAWANPARLYPHQSKTQEALFAAAAVVALGKGAGGEEEAPQAVGSSWSLLEGRPVKIVQEEGRKLVAMEGA